MRVIAVSEHVARDALQRFPALDGRLETIPPGINFDRFDPAIVRADRVIKLAGELRVPDGSHLILCPARFDSDRGQKILIEAVKRLGRDDVFCLLLGSTGTPTPFERELERAIVAAELHGRVQIGPYVDDMPAAYMLADVVVSTGGARAGLQPRAGRGAGDGPPGGGRGRRRRRRSGAARRHRLAGAGGDPAALARRCKARSPRPNARRAARAAQEQVRGRYACQPTASCCSFTNGAGRERCIALLLACCRPRLPRSRDRRRRRPDRFLAPPTAAGLPRHWNPLGRPVDQLPVSWHAHHRRRRRSRLWTLKGGTVLRARRLRRQLDRPFRSRRPRLPQGHFRLKPAARPSPAPTSATALRFPSAGVQPA